METPWDGKRLIKLATDVRTEDGEQKWVDLQRYSRRQNTRLKIGGIIGWQTFSGDALSEFIPMLRLMEWLHVGKLTTMGLGKITLHPT
jgi:CRISPR/Cas system endoribonuclease Cas6 (RAMP superfamily)